MYTNAAQSFSNSRTFCPLTFEAFVQYWWVQMLQKVPPSDRAFLNTIAAQVSLKPRQSRVGPPVQYQNFKCSIISPTEPSGTWSGIQLLDALQLWPVQILRQNASRVRDVIVKVQGYKPASATGDATTSEWVIILLIKALLSFRSLGSTRLRAIDNTRSDTFH